MWGEEGIAAFVEELEADGLTPDQALAGLRMHRPPDGKDFPPSVAAVSALAHSDPSSPTFDEAVQVIAHVLKARTRVSKGSWEYGERDELNRQEMVERAAGVHPLVQAFIRAQGLDRLRTLDLADEEYGQARRAQLRVAWESFAEAHAGREVAALVSARRGQLGSFDPLSALDTGFPPRKLGSGLGQ
jgi:hypothetical protein